MSLVALESELSETEHRAEELEVDNNYVEDLVTKVDDTKKVLKACKDHVLYLKGQATEETSQSSAERSGGYISQ